MATKPTARIKRDPKFAGKLEKLRKRVKGAGVEVGVLAGTGEHPNATGGQTVAEIAVWNEFGTPGARSPIRARSFIRATTRMKKAAYRILLRKLLHKMVLGEITSDTALRILGMVAQRDIRTTIRKVKFPINAPSTRKRKKSKNPLIDTGLLRQSINWAKIMRRSIGR